MKVQIQMKMNKIQLNLKKKQNKPIMSMKKLMLIESKPLHISQKEKEQITILQVLAYLKTQKAADNVTCLNKVVKDDMQIFEISYATNEDKAKYDGILNGKILVNNIVLTKIDNRPFKDIVKVPFISVAIFGYI